MLTAAEYRKRSRKTITLPSGGEVEIRKVHGDDFLSVGEIPRAFHEAVSAKDQMAAEAILRADPGFEKRMDTAILINGVISINLVDKHPRDCGDDEVSLKEFSREDTRFIISEIILFNSMNAGAGKSIRRFPEESDPPGDGGVDGAPVREAAV